MNPEEQAYDAAGEALVDWVDTHKDTVDGSDEMLKELEGEQ